MPEAPSIKEAFDEWFASNYGWLGVGDQLLKSDMKQAWDAALATLQPSGERREAIARLATRFWSIHPKEIQDMGLTREQFYVREMTTLLASGLVQDEAGIRRDEREKCAKWHEAKATGIKKYYDDEFNPFSENSEERAEWRLIRKEVDFHQFSAAAIRHNPNPSRKRGG